VDGGRRIPGEIGVIGTNFARWGSIRVASGRRPPTKVEVPMNDRPEPSAEDPAVVDVNIVALRRPDPPAEVDMAALRRPGLTPDVDAGALTRPAPPPPAPAAGRRRRLVIGTAATAMVLLAGAGALWHRQVTTDPRLEFSGPNVYRDEAATDHTGIVTDDSRQGVDEVDTVRAAFVPNGRLYASFGLYNGGGHDVRIEAAQPARMYYWGFDRMTLSTDRNTGFGGRYEPLPFTLHRGETRYLRLEFHLADCDPTAFAPGGSSTLRSLRVQYRILGVTRSHDVPFRDSALAVQATGDCAHPIVESNR
jgi:hypothetical protein